MAVSPSRYVAPPMEQQSKRMINGYELLLTCGACPEQYDVLKDGEQVGYLRLRHGYFRADYPDCGGETVYEAEPDGDGEFLDEERGHYLTEAVNALDARLRRTSLSEEGSEFYSYSNRFEQDGPFAAHPSVSDEPAKHEDAVAAEPEGGQRGGEAETPLSPPPAETSRGEAKREQIARIIAPGAWSDYDAKGYDNGRTRRDREWSLERADEIIALYTHPLPTVMELVQCEQCKGTGSGGYEQIDEDHFEPVPCSDCGGAGQHPMRPHPTVTEDYAGLIEWLEHEAEVEEKHARPTETRGFAEYYAKRATKLRDTAQALRTLQQENPLLREAWEPSASEAIEIATLRQKNKELEEERDRLKSLCTEGMWETVESEQGWKGRALAAEAAITASQAEAERLRGEVERAEHLLNLRTRQLQTSKKYWVAAAKKALAGDPRDLQLRVEMVEAGPLELIQSEDRAALSKKPAAEEEMGQ
ncbi:MAG TPA: hypothetical protein VEZ24_09545 [Microvirga sp.]|nr:hypothetical protein [Microvirga sp.]